MIKRKGNVYKLDTPATTLLIRAGDCAEYLYYGERLTLPLSDYGFLTAPERDGESALKVFSSFDGRDFRRAGAVCTFADGSFSPRFVFVRAKLTEKPVITPLPSSYSDSDAKNSCRTLCLEFIDEPSRLKLFLYYTAFDDSDVIAVSSRLLNGGKKEVRVKNLASLQLDVYGDDYSFVAFREGPGGPDKRSVSVNGTGVVSEESAAGFGSRFANSFVMLENARGVYAFNLVYSGNYKETAEADSYPRTRVLIGINDFMLDKALAPGESFSSPEALMTFAADEDKACLAMSGFVGKHIVRGKWKERERPVIIEDAEGSSDSDRERILSAARKAAELGAEVFVADCRGIGREAGGFSPDAREDFAEKTGDIASLADSVRETGLKFGIRIEPESIGEESELYKKHPEFAMKIPGREPVRVRGRVLLNLADPRVQKYLIRAVSSVVSETKAAYVRWDYDRPMSDCFCRGVPSGEYFLRYTEGLYTVAGKLAEKFPGVLFEGCAGGGGGFDPGLLCFMPQLRISDDFDRLCRYIRSGVLCGYPQSCAVSRVSSACRTEGGLSLEARFDVAVFGALGYGIEPAKLSERETEAVKEQIAFYKARRRLLQYGNMYRLNDTPGTGEGKFFGFVCVSENKASAVALVAARGEGTGTGELRVLLKGLDEGTMYSVSDRRQGDRERAESFVASGEALMKGGVFLKGFFGDSSFERCTDSLSTRLLLIEKVKRSKPDDAIVHSSRKEENAGKN